LMDGQGKMLTVWGCNAFQTTCNAERYREAIYRRSRLVKEAMAGTRDPEAMAGRIHEALKKGGLFVTVIDLYPTRFAQAAHLLFPAAHPGEMNLTSMNGERRIRLSERFMDPPGEARPDCLIAADIANALKALYEAEGNRAMAERFGGFDWKTEEDAFNDGFRRAHVADIESQGGKTGHLVTYARLRAMGNNGVQLPARAFEKGKLIGTERLYADGRFDTEDGRARFLPSPWRGLPETVAAQKAKYRFWINNGRTNQVWQTGYHNRYVDFVDGRYPMAPIELNPGDAEALGIGAGDIVEVYNDYGSTFAMAYPEPDIKPGQAFMMYGWYNGTVGDVVTEWTDENVVPYYKGTWANIRRVG
ncbi:MAG: arsenate reductase (azurin) large subunit, partial [Gammaproteobacteria bacterium]